MDGIYLRVLYNPLWGIAKLWANITTMNNSRLRINHCSFSILPPPSPYILLMRQRKLSN